MKLFNSKEAIYSASHKAMYTAVNEQKSLNAKQEGATLIMTMIVLLIISIIAVMAFKRSSTDLSISTTAQGKVILFQSAEVGTSSLEKTAETGEISNAGNIIPHLKMPGTSNDRIGNEITFCVKPLESKLFNNAKVSEKSAYGGHVGGMQNGYCNPETDTKAFLSARQVSTLQMSIERRVPRTKGEAFALENDRSTIGGAEIPGTKERFKPLSFKATSVAVLPAFSSDIKYVNKCLKLKAAQGKATDTATHSDACLKSKKIPQTITEQGYIHRLFSGV